MTTQTYHVFISYSHKDSELAKSILAKLTKAGLSCFLAEKNVRAAERWEARVRDALRVSEWILLIITPNSKDSAWVVAEAGAAWALDKHLVPALAYVKPDELITPISSHQARTIHTPEEIQRLVEELSSSIFTVAPRRMTWESLGAAIIELSERVMRSDVCGGFRPLLVVGVNPGGAIVGSVMYYLNRDRFHFTTIWAGPKSRLVQAPAAIEAAVAVARNGRRGDLRVLLVDDGMKTGQSLRSAADLVTQAARGPDKLIIKTAVIAYRRLQDGGPEPDFYVFEEYSHMPYAEI